jgi:DNA-binding NarL/FixJ family response regulator
MHSDDSRADAVARTLSSALAELDAGRPVSDVLPQVMAALRAAQADDAAPVDPASGTSSEAAPRGSREPMTTRELEVLLLLSEGHLARSIAARLEVSTRTVHKHLGSVYRKLGVRSRTELARHVAGGGLRR